jgi:3alpha(or 20beta)-hydroxysteroid dehydrogenase
MTNTAGVHGNARQGRVAGKVAIVTGGAQGQGAAEARLLAAEGACVVLTDLAEDLGRRLAADIGPAARFAPHDVSNEDDWDRVAALALAEFGRIDILVNNAGVNRVVSIEDETLDGFMRVMSVNVAGAFLGIRTMIAPMRRDGGGGGAIVNIGSVAGLYGAPQRIAYGTSKAGLRGLTRYAAFELAADQIRVNCVLPGPIDTAMLDGDRADVAKAVPLGRPGQPADVAELVLFLASDASSFITGTELTIDGGLASGRKPSFTPS